MASETGRQDDQPAPSGGLVAGRLLRAAGQASSDRPPPAFQLDGGTTPGPHDHTRTTRGRRLAASTAGATRRFAGIPHARYAPDRFGDYDTKRRLAGGGTTPGPHRYGFARGPHHPSPMVDRVRVASPAAHATREEATRRCPKAKRTRGARRALRRGDRPRQGADADRSLRPNRHRRVP